MAGKTDTLNELNERNDTELNPGDFRAFLAWLAPNSLHQDDAYESARRRLILFFAGRKCLEPEALADRTLDCAMRKVAEIPAEAAPLAYLIGIAKNIHRDELRAAQKLEAVRSALVTTPAQPLPDQEQRHTCLEKCLAELPTADRRLVLGYYSETKQAKIDRRKQLADECGLSLNALRNRIFRLNQRLALCVTSCLEQIPA
ncbi:MAG: hypothetical protein U0X75_13305 [Acidobacteriota bacterium]